MRGACCMWWSSQGGGRASLPAGITPSAARVHRAGRPECLARAFSRTREAKTGPSQTGRGPRHYSPSPIVDRSAQRTRTVAIAPSPAPARANSDASTLHRRRGALRSSTGARAREPHGSRETVWCGCPGSAAVQTASQTGTAIAGGQQPTATGPVPAADLRDRPPTRPQRRPRPGGRGQPARLPRQVLQRWAAAPRERDGGLQGAADHQLRRRSRAAAGEAARHLRGAPGARPLRPAGRPPGSLLRARHLSPRCCR
jgi:hypothetical protein